MKAVNKKSFVSSRNEWTLRPEAKEQYEHLKKRQNAEIFHTNFANRTSPIRNHSHELVIAVTLIGSNARQQDCKALASFLESFSIVNGQTIENKR